MNEHWISWKKNSSLIVFNLQYIQCYNVSSYCKQHQSTDIKGIYRCYFPSYKKRCLSKHRSTTIYVNQWQAYNTQNVRQVWQGLFCVNVNIDWLQSIFLKRYFLMIIRNAVTLYHIRSGIPTMKMTIQTYPVLFNANSSVDNDEYERSAMQCIPGVYRLYQQFQSNAL